MNFPITNIIIFDFFETLQTHAASLDIAENVWPGLGLQFEPKVRRTLLARHCASQGVPWGESNQRNLD
jgi:hypothetical protein